MATKKTKQTKKGDTYAPKPFSDAFVELTDSAQKEEEQKPTPKKIGRPSKYTPQLAEEICERLSNGEPLRQICRDDHMPAWQKIYEWMNKDETLSGAIARARDLGYDNMAEECLHIADNIMIGSIKTIDDEGGITVKHEDMLGHRKLQIETRLKLLAKFNPKRYGDAVKLSGDAENPLELGNTMFGELLKNVELKLQVKNEQ